MVPIKNIPVIYISPDHNQKYNDRKIATEKILTDIGFSDITHYRSSSEQYPKCLALAFIDILESHLDDNPILVVEDDIGWTGVENIDIPDGADAIYFGNSIWASHPIVEINVPYCQLSTYSTTQLRVHNMLATHAILYISKKYKEQIIYQLKNCLVHHVDIPITRVQSNFLVLTNKYPIFFQDDGCNRDVTCVEFDIDESGLKMRSCLKRVQ